MFNLKNTIFLDFTPRQKAMLMSFLKSFIKKNQSLSKEDIIDKFIEDETYYNEINNPHFEFVLPFLSDDNFLRDMKTFIDAVFYELKQKEAMKPLIEKQKQFQKEQRKRANDFKMSKLKPTKKQLFYYEKVAHAHGIEMKDTKNATRLDLRNWIMEIIEPREETNEEE